MIWAVKNNRRDLVDRALKTDKSTYYRFRCPEGLFYAVWSHDVDTVVTVMDQAMFKNKKWAWKMWRQKRGKNRR